MLFNRLLVNGPYRNINQTSTSFGTTYKTITINKTYVPSTQTNFVIKIAASLFGSDFFDKLAIGGSARFTLDDGVTLLSSEKVYLNTGTDTGYYNVLVPTLNGTSEGSSTAIRVYYENSLSDLDATDTYGRNSVWVNNYKCVQHLQTTPDQTQVNSTGNSSYDMTGLGGLGSGDVVTAYYGGGNAHIYDATGQGVRVGYTDITGYPFSIGVAFRTPTDQYDQGYIAGITDSTNSGLNDMNGLYKTGLKDPKSLFALAGSSGIVNAPFISAMQSTSWNFGLAVYASATSRKLYLNSTTPVTNTTSVAFTNKNSTGIGALFFGSANQFFLGDLAVQDFFITNHEITADTYTTMYNNYTNGSFFTVT